MVPPLSRRDRRARGRAEGAGIAWWAGIAPAVRRRLAPLGRSLGGAQAWLGRLLRRRLSRDTVAEVAVAVGLATAVYLAIQAVRHLPPPAVQTVILASTLRTDRPPAWRTDIYGPPSSPLRGPLGVGAAPGGLVYVADTGNAQVQVFTREGRWVRRFGRYGHGPGEFDYPMDVLYLRGRVYVADLKNSRVQVLTPEGRFLRALPDPRATPGLRFAPTALAADGAGRLYVATVDHQVLVFDRRLRLVRRLGRPGQGAGELSYPNGVAVDAAGRVWVADSGNGRLQVFDRRGRVVRLVEGFAVPRGLAVFGGKVLAVETLQHRLYALGLDGGVAYTFGERGTREATFNFPNDVAVDALGTVYVADRENNRVSVWSYGP